MCLAHLSEAVRWTKNQDKVLAWTILNFQEKILFFLTFFFLDKKETKNQDCRKKAQNLRVIFLPENKAAAGM